jgi:hypothetical protein
VLFLFSEYNVFFITFTLLIHSVRESLLSAIFQFTIIEFLSFTFQSNSNKLFMFLVSKILSPNILQKLLLLASSMTSVLQNPMVSLRLYCTWLISTSWCIWPSFFACCLHLILTLLVFLCVSWLSTTVRKYLDDQLKERKGLFWFIVSELLIHGHLSCCFGPVMVQYIMVEAEVACSPHGSCETEREKRG